MDQAEPSSSNRSSRQKSDKRGSLSAIEKLRQLKGGSGYVEDDCDICDNDLNDNDVQEVTEKKTRVGAKQCQKIEIKNNDNMKNMLTNMPSKKKANDSLNNNDIILKRVAEPKTEKPKSKRKDTRVRNIYYNPKTQLTKRQRSPIPQGVDNFLEPMFEGSKPTKLFKRDDDTTKANSGEETINDGAKIETCTSQISEIEPSQKDQARVGNDHDKLTETESAAIHNIKVDMIDGVPRVINQNGDRVFRFYWWDAYENQWKKPGTVYLFGKVYIEKTESYVSCCLQVQHIPRRIYLLPRKFIQGSKDNEKRETSMADVLAEFNAWATKNHVKEFRSRKVTKKYAFDRERTPKESEYLEVQYSATFPTMDSNYSGPAIEHVFGTSVNALEFFLLEREIKGPCWLDVKDALPSPVPVSWCKLQVDCSNFNNISVCREATQICLIPPLVVATLNIRMSLNAKTQENEVAMIALMFHSNYEIGEPPPEPLSQGQCCLVTHPCNIPWPRDARDLLAKIKSNHVICFKTESDLFERFFFLMEKFDPDILIGYDCSFQLDVLMHRISALKVENWSRIGKLRCDVIPLYKNKVNLERSFCGRPICDIQTSVKQLRLKVRDYDLQSLYMAVFKKTDNDYVEVKPVECPKFYEQAEKLHELVEITMNEAHLITTLSFKLNLLPLAVQITRLAGNVLSRTLSTGCAERIEYLLLHAFSKKGFITPDKKLPNKKTGQTGQENSQSKKPGYSGGLVLEPKKGFYEKLILLMDFNSLYPSIIQEYNICFTTVTDAARADTTNLVIPARGLPPGVLPEEIRTLVNDRRAVEKLMKTPNLSPQLKFQCDIQQLALKFMANSLYGCLGASYGRFYAKGLAALITSKGREILQSTKKLVEELNYEVIYGDTDSLMINTNILDYDEALTIATKIKQQVNKLYQRIELGIDGIFRYLLLLQKKQYAALVMSKTPSGQIETVVQYTGLDIVKRDWCQMACDTGKLILDNLLSDQSDETRRNKIFEILLNVATSLREARVPLSSLVIMKQLSKNPIDYRDKKIPHVSTALRLNTMGGRMWKAGDIVPYVICEDGTSNSATERAYHVDEVEKNETLKIDVDYYLRSQIFPIVLRICEPIEGIDDVILAQHLGLKHIYNSKKVINEEEDIRVRSPMKDDRFKDCLPLRFKCRNENCWTSIEIKEPFTTFPSGTLPSLAQCANDKCDLPPWKYVKYIQNQLEHILKRLTTMYNSVECMECKIPTCTTTTRYVSMKWSQNTRCNDCTKVAMSKTHSDTKLYNQLCFYSHLLDLSHAPKGFEGVNLPEMIAAYDVLKDCVEKHRKRHPYSVTDLTTLFAPLRPPSSNR